MFYSQFLQAGSDNAPAHIASRTSSDGGLTWSEATVQFQAPAGALNAMAVSLLRLQDGRIGTIIPIKWTEYHMTPMWTYSTDEGATWTELSPLSEEKEYFCVLNDRLIQLTDGTLALPYARLNPEQEKQPAEFDYRWNMICGVFFSRDGGKTWHRSPHEITHTPEFFTPPLVTSPGQSRSDMAYQLENRLGVFQEPGLQQLADGSLLMFMRSSYAVYRCFASSIDAPWKNCGIIPGLNVCCGPQAMRRLPASGHLLMLYNDRGPLAWGEKDFHFRTPLSIAISRDEGQTWEKRGELEDDSRNYCYYSILFVGPKFVISYYESAPTIKSGKATRRNLASLKVCTGYTEFFNL